MSTESAVEPYEVILYIFAILAVILNGLLLMSMYKERKKIFVTRISFLVANLALADFLVGLFVILLYQPINKLKILKGETVEKLKLPFTWTVSCTSFYTLLLMAAERLAAEQLC